jgi:hypothetical protein
MAAINIIITDAGLAEVINAEQTGTAPVVLTEVGLGTGQYTPDASRTSLVAEFKRLNAIAGGSIGDNALHLTAQDSGSDAYTVYEFGIYTSSGTLFAVYSQPIPILQKASVAHALLAMDIVLTNIDPDSVTVGDTNFQLNGATTTKQGIVELATGEEVIAGTDGSRAVTPSALSARTATTGRTGLVELATNAEAIAGTDGSRAITPAALAAAFVREQLETGFQKVPGGTLIQWGKALIAPDGTTRIVFPQAFPNACQYASALSTDAVQPSYSVASKSAEAVNFKHNGNGGVNSVWFAVGY